MNQSHSPDLFIVDNSNGDRKVRSYLREWCDLSIAIEKEVLNKHLRPLQAGPGPATQFPTYAESFPPLTGQSIPALSASTSKNLPDSLKPRVDCVAFFSQLVLTSLPFVSTAGRGAVPSGTAPAFYSGRALLFVPIPVPIS